MSVLDFESLEEGSVLGQHRVLLGDDTFARWSAIFPEDIDGDVMAPGMAAPMMMQAYAEILKKKPKGNIHGGQRFTFHRLPRLGTHITTEFRCVAKTLKGTRKWVDLEFWSGTDEGKVCWTGRMTVLWAR